MKTTFFLIFVFLAAPVWAAQESTAIVNIETKNVDGSASIGSGFFATSNKIYTCYHVIEKAGIIEITNSQGQTHKLTSRGGNFASIKVSPMHDLAVIQIPDSFRSDKTLPIDHMPPDFIEVAHVHTRKLGNTHPWPVTVLKNFAPIQDVNKFEDHSILSGEDGVKNVNIILLQASTLNGMSGSPIIVEGRAIAVLSGSREVGTDFAWAIALQKNYIEQLKPFIERKSLPQIYSENFRSSVQRRQSGLATNADLFVNETINEWRKKRGYVQDIKLRRRGDAIDALGKSALKSKRSVEALKLAEELKMLLKLAKGPIVTRTLRHLKFEVLGIRRLAGNTVEMDIVLFGKRDARLHFSYIFTDPDGNSYKARDLGVPVLANAPVQRTIIWQNIPEHVTRIHRIYITSPQKGKANFGPIEFTQ